MRRKKKEKKPALILRIVRRYGWNPGRVASEILEWVEVLVVAGILAFLVISFVTVRMHVPTDSMYPTINGDRSALRADSFFVDKISYYFRDPKPGDIVVFWHTEAFFVRAVKDDSPAERAGVQPGQQIGYVNRERVYSTAQADELIASLPVGTKMFLGLSGSASLDLGEKQPQIDSLADLGITTRESRVRYVKRLIAVGGQIIQIQGGAIYVDGKKLAGERFDRYYYSNLPGLQYGIEPTLVPEGKWFVLGDNSKDSFDSRYWGFVDERDFIGEPYLRVWPLPRFGPMNGYFGFHRGG
jgi:signal peptidase I